MRAANPRTRLVWTTLLGACLADQSVVAAEAPADKKTAAPPLTQEQLFEGGTNTYSNWLELSAGGTIVNGDEKQFRQRQAIRSGAFGGIEDLHYETKWGKQGLFQLDGRAIVDNRDYALRLEASRPEVGFLRAGFKQYRTWYDGGGAFYPPNDTYYSLFEHALGLDRGELWVEGGLTPKDGPSLTVKYSHQYRNGQKDSTIWGLSNIGVVPAKGLVPSFWDIAEKSDSFQADLKYKIKKTALGLGLRYESGNLDDALKIDQLRSDPVNERKITDREATQYDLFNIHAFTETWLNKKTFFSTGFSYANVDSGFYGSRIGGTDWDVPFNPALANATAFLNQGGNSHAQEYVMNVNFMFNPSPNWSLVPSVRVQKEDVNGSFQALQTSLLGNTPINGVSSRGLLDVTERLELRYTGITNWVFYVRGDWTEGEGNYSENGGGGVAPPVLQLTDDNRWLQKYTAGAKWYPTRRLNLDAQYYHKAVANDYNNKTDNTPNDSTSPGRYPAYLVGQDFTTDGASLRATWRPHKNWSSMSRYEFQYSTIDTQPDPVSALDKIQTARMISHIFGQNLTWVPWTRLYLQLGFNYVFSKTATPASDYTRAVLDAQNNYWSLDFAAGFALDKKTDLQAQYFYFQSDNYTDNSTFGVPYGLGAAEHGVTFGIIHRLRENLRLNLKYGFFSYRDDTSGGNKDYNAHLIYSSLQYRF